MAGAASAVAAFLVLLNFAMCIAVIAIAGWAMNKYIDDGTVPGENEATPYFILFSLIAGVIGAASCSYGAENVRRGTQDLVPAAVGVSLISAAFNLLAFGFACKHINRKTDNAKLKALEAFIIILTITKKMFTAAILSTAEVEVTKSVA